MYFRSVLFASIVVVSFFFFFSSRVVSASCAPPVSLAGYKEQADIVILGHVTSVSNKSATVTVERYFKDHGGPAQIEVTGQESPGVVTSVDFAFAENKRYLLFLQKLSSGILKTNACMGNKEVQGVLTTEDLAVLGSGYLPNSTGQGLSPSKTPARAGSNSSENLTVRNLIASTGGLLLLVVVAVAWKKLHKKSS